ncbi:hypothetical protein [Xanthomonas sacchari]|uniref:hypothetical protein n=1 Tax=Xanthomonas sacchari TaxID=56458 RepID=UPI003B213CE9
MPADLAARGRLCRFHHDHGSSAAAERAAAARSKGERAKDATFQNLGGHAFAALRHAPAQTFASVLLRDGAVNLDTSAAAACATLDADLIWKPVD